MDKNTAAVANNGLGISILQALWNENAEHANLFISPYSISLALGMTLNGACAETRDAMAKVLGVPADKLDEVNAAVSELIASLKDADPEVQMEIANAIFSKLGYPFKQPFLDTNTTHYGAELRPLDFEGDADGSVKAINDWCSEHTKGKIPGIIDQIPPAAALFLINAIYFKGNWAEPFEKDLTKDRTFTKTDGGTIQVPTMQQFSELDYHETTEFQAVRLPYSKGRFAMTVVLPQQGKTLGDVVTALSADEWKKTQQALRSRDGQLWLPKFKIEYFTKLNEVLKTLGMEIAFDGDRADFGDMVLDGDRVYINEVRHKTFVDVNEEGTEAAAVTSVGMVFATSIRIPIPPFQMDVNRPFLVAVTDTTTGAILFAGAITEPTSK